MTTPSATAPDGQSHTPTPWHSWQDAYGRWHVGTGERTVADVMHSPNAAHIVHCVNSYDQLLAQNAVLLAQREELLGLICEAVAFGDIEFDTWRGFVQRCEEAIANASKVSP